MIFSFGKDSKKEDEKEKTGAERRQSTRIAKSFILTYYAANNPDEKLETSQLRNISSGGVCFISSCAFETGTKLSIELQTPYLSDTTYLEGIVLQSHVKAKNLIYETRLEFDNLDTKSQVVLNKLMEVLEKTEAEEKDE